MFRCLKLLLSSWSRILRLPQWAFECLYFFCKSCKRQNAVRLDMSSQHSWNILYLSVLFLCTITWLEAKRRRHLDGLLFWDVFLMISFELKNVRYYNDSWTPEILSHSTKNSNLLPDKLILFNEITVIMTWKGQHLKMGLVKNYSIFVKVFL